MKATRLYMLFALLIVLAVSCNNQETTINGHEYVDLGLPSGTLWATCNVGAEVSEDYGDYFAWGETKTKDFYDSINYLYCEGNFNTITKYCNNSEYGKAYFTDTLTELLDCDDPATAWGIDWHMPSIAQWDELLQNTTNKRTTQNNIKGILFTAKNGQTLFLPATSVRWNAPIYDDGFFGTYWSKSLCTDEFYPPSRAYALFFSSEVCDWGAAYRCGGMSVRPVTSSH